MLRKVSFCAIILWISAMNLIAQSLNGGKTDVLPVQEKVYLHLDNNCYFLGDTIWYKAYVVLADDNSPQPLSRILYTELLNEQGYVVERQKLVLSETGQADGCFAICDTTFAGFYEVRAYTKWMLNFGYDKIPSWHLEHWLPYNANSEGISTGGGGGPDNIEYKIVDGVGADIDNLEEDNRKLQELAETDSEEERNDSEIEKEKGDYNYREGLNVYKDGMDRNFRDYGNLFSRVVPVYSRPDSAEKYLQKIMPTKITMGDYEVRWKEKEFNMQFYPEGGTLLLGHECRVAWEVFNQEIERMNVSGALYEDGEFLDSIHPYHGGRGFFTFTPKKGKNYKVKFTFPSDHFSFDLPKAEKEGARLIVTEDDEAVYFDVEKEFETDQTLYLSVYCRGKKVHRFRIDGKDKWEDAMYLDDLPEGVNQAVLADELGNVYADRLFFVNKLYESQGKILVDGVANRAYTPLEKIRLSMLATDAKGRPLQDQTFSVSVRDADQLDPTFDTSNILTNLLLQSEIKGFVETPDYYFEANDEHHRTALDLLLMIQGWRRYEWRDIEKPELSNLRYLPEQKMVINGQAFPLRKKLFVKDLGLLQISCSILNLNDDLKEGDYYKFKGVVEADSDGRFSFAYDPFYGNVKLTLRGKFVRKLDKKKYDLLSHDKEIFIAKEYYYPQTTRAYSWYETNSPELTKEKKLTWEEFQQDIYATEWIPQVNIKSKKRPHAKRQKDKPVFETDFLDFINDQWDQGFYNATNLFDNQNVSPMDAFIGSYVRGQYMPTINNHENHVYSMNWDTNFGQRSLLNSFLPILDRIIVVSDAPRRPTPFEHYHQDRRENGETTFGIDSYINFITFPNDKTKRTVGREYNFQGFNRPVEYYNPDYSKASLPDIHDYRRTLYWNPNVTTDKYGRANIEFYNNSVSKVIDISAEGISKYGQFLINE